MEEEEIKEDAIDVYVLRRPIQYGETRITELRLSEPTMEQAAGMKFDIPADEKITSLPYENDKALKVIKACTTVAPSVLKKMKVSDASLCYYKCLNLFFAQ